MFTSAIRSANSAPRRVILHAGIALTALCVFSAPGSAEAAYRNGEISHWNKFILKYGFRFVDGAPITVPHGTAWTSGRLIDLKKRIDGLPFTHYQPLMVGAWESADWGHFSATFFGQPFRVTVTARNPDELRFGLCRIEFGQLSGFGVTLPVISEEHLCINFRVDDEGSGGANNNMMGLYFPEIDLEMWPKREDRLRIVTQGNEFEFDSRE
ncbi:hypothetical protein ACSRUE_16675 [Sorangium sp. KYC3313]|uniref:hypothetical protein n=1 Tax=Sorangium sp. KYC3313 TaxID=3449740 RepID=UPI003F891036